MLAMSSVQYQNKKVVEPAIDLDNTVPTPELNDDTIYSSNLTFINISEGLHKLIDQKICNAQQRHIDQMKQKNHEVQAHKSLLRALEKDGLSVIPAIDADDQYDNIDFKSCGDLDKDLQSIEEKTFKAQTQLLALDEKYYPVHMEIKVFHLTIGSALTRFCLIRFTLSMPLQLSHSPMSLFIFHIPCNLSVHTTMACFAVTEYNLNMHQTTETAHCKAPTG